MRKLSYVSVVVARLNSVVGWKPVGKDWGRLGAIVKRDRPYVDYVLDVLESFPKTEIDAFSFSLGSFQSLVTLARNGGDVRKRVAYIINEGFKSIRDEIEEAQEKGSDILESLKKGY